MSLYFNTVSNHFGSPAWSSTLAREINQRCYEEEGGAGADKIDGAVVIQVNATSLDMALSARLPTHVNAHFEPFAALCYALRDRQEDFLIAASKIRLTNEEQYGRVLGKFTELHEQIKTSVNGYKSDLTNADVINLAAHYVAIAMCSRRCDTSLIDGQYFSQDLEKGKFDLLEWNFVPFSLDKYSPVYMRRVAEKLKDVTISSLDWKMLVFRSLTDLAKDKKKAYFIFDFPSLPAEFTREEFDGFLNHVFYPMHMRGHQIIVVSDRSHENATFLGQFGASIEDNAQVGLDVKSGLFYLGERDKIGVNIACGSLFSRYAIVLT
jgi:hypothetical protein